MNITKHTTAPWRVETSGFTSVLLPAIPEDNRGFTLATFWGPDREANARLCAAAPDLLAVAHRLSVWAARAPQRSVFTVADLQGIVCEVNAAIAKAFNP